MLALLSRGEGRFETRELGVSFGQPLARDFVAAPGGGGMAPQLYVLYGLTRCPDCTAGCAGRCLFDLGCVSCLSDADFRADRCVDQACVPSP